MSNECERPHLCDERFARDKERITELEKQGDTTASLISQTVFTLERVNKQLDDHEVRLRDAEKRPGAWFDRIASALMAAAVSAAVAWFSSGGAA